MKISKTLSVRHLFRSSNSDPICPLTINKCDYHPSVRRCGTQTVSSLLRHNGISHDTDLERICRLHISHRKRLITVNPFTSFRAGVNTKKPRNIFIHLCPGLFYIARPTLCRLCLLTISHCELPSCLCGPSDLPSPSICKDQGLIKTIFPINIPGPWSPSSRAGGPPGLLQCCSGPHPSSAIQRQRRCV